MRDKPRREILTGDKDGVVTIWDLKTQSPIYVLKAHTDVITQMKWIESKQLLVTCAKDKSIKVWKFPAVWIDESQIEDAKGAEVQQEAELSQNEDSNSEDEIVNVPIAKVEPAATSTAQPVLKVKDDDSDEDDDDLTGWNN